MSVPDVKKYLRSEAMPTLFCTGCGHGILLHCLLIAIDELKKDYDNMVFVSGIGCAAWIPSPHMAADTLHTTHGRPIAYATGVKAYRPDLDVVVVSGDGDIVSIGGNHLIHAARRNTDITVIMANNKVYGMTGGQQASTTPHGCITLTTPQGNPERDFDTCRLVLGADAGFVARETVAAPRNLIKVIKAALTHEGFAFVETVSTCVTHFGKMNGMPSPEAMIANLKEKSVRGTGTDLLTKPLEDGRFYTGIFTSGAG